MTTAGWRISIEDPDLCPRYAARLITGVTVGPSPAWLAQRLRAAGLRPINNVVDVTNYVLWELGHPLHAFDGDLLTDRHVVVRRARPGRDGGDPGRADAARSASRCSSSPTRRARWRWPGSWAAPTPRCASRPARCSWRARTSRPGSIRRTAKALGLSTEASYRFERGADIEGLRDALDRAARLIAELGEGRVAAGVLDAYPAPRRPAGGAAAPRAHRSGSSGRARPGRWSPTSCAASAFRRRSATSGFEVVVPAFRRDVAIEDDLVEEVARVWGYEKIPSTLPSGALALTRRPAPHGGARRGAPRPDRRGLLRGRLAVADRPRAPAPSRARAGRSSRRPPPEPARHRPLRDAADAAVRPPGGAGDQRPPPGARRAALRDRAGVRGRRARASCPGRTPGSGSC